MVSWIKQFFKKAEPINLLGSRGTFVKEQEASSTPWAMFEIVNFDDEGQVKVEFSWNKPFIERLDELGFTAETEEDTVQLFFYTSQMQPSALSEVSGDQSVQIADLPQLSANVNKPV